MQLSELLPLLNIEIKTASVKYGPFHNSHEHYAVLQEEVDEWWDTVKDNTSGTSQSHYELLQVAAVALRYLMENGSAKNIELIQKTRYR